MFYRFDIEKWAVMVLPPILRRPVMRAFIKALVYPLRSTYNDFLRLKNHTDRVLSANAFVGPLEHHLNGMFNQPDGTISISDYIDEDKVYMSFRDEIMEAFYISNGSNTVYLSSMRPAALKGEFVVNVPVTLGTQENIASIREEVNFYKYAGTTFTIKTY